MVRLNGEDKLILLTELPSPDQKPDDNLIAQRFVAAVGQSIDFKILAHWSWTPGRALVADSYGRGRVVLAGDSVHLFTPPGGFGMNTGVDDAANLGWNCCLVQGWEVRSARSYGPSAGRASQLSMAKSFSRNVGSLPVPPEIEDSRAGRWPAIDRRHLAELHRRVCIDRHSARREIQQLSDHYSRWHRTTARRSVQICPQHSPRLRPACVAGSDTLFDHFGMVTLLLLPRQTMAGIVAAAYREQNPAQTACCRHAGNSRSLLRRDGPDPPR
jgi:hypothetical protein